MDYELLSFILRSKQRILILKRLKNPTTPTQIAHEVKVSVSHVSRTLRDFEKSGLVICKTPNAKTGRIYVITDLGKGILTEIEKQSQSE